MKPRTQVTGLVLEHAVDVVIEREMYNFYPTLRVNSLFDLYNIIKYELD